MSSRFDSISSLMKKQDVLLNIICLIFALIFLGLVVSNISRAGDFFTVDSLFITVVFLLLAGVFLVSPALWAHEHGLFKQFLAVDDEEGTTAHAPAEVIHFAGSTKLFLSILGYLLALTLVEVFLGYKHFDLRIMLTLLLGLSLVKAVLIVAYFMHLRYERTTLVLSLIPMLVICICLLFVFFPDGMRLLNLRAYK